MGSDVKKEFGLENDPIDSWLAVETVRNPATKDVTAKAAVAMDESIKDTTGTESVRSLFKISTSRKE